MPRPRKKAHARRRQYGTVHYSDHPRTLGLPVAFKPVNGVMHRLPSLQSVEFEYERGRLSPEDMERSRAAWAAYRERMENSDYA